MWIMTEIGFFSIVKKTGMDLLCVRARVKKDLVSFKKLCKSMTSIEHNTGTDYEFRAYAEPYDVGYALACLVGRIDYPNFKDRVESVHGEKRSKLYHRIWSVLIGLAKRVVDHVDVDFGDDDGGFGGITPGGGGHGRLRPPSRPIRGGGHGRLK